MKDSTSIRWGGVGVGFLAMACAGWILGGGTGAQTEDPSASNSSPAPRVAPSRPRGRYQTPEHAEARVKAIRGLGTTEDQMRATIALANTIPLDELGDWLEGRWFDNVGDYNLSLFNKVARRRWAREDPEGLIAWSLKSGGRSGSEILGEWAREDPERLAGYFREHPNPRVEARYLEGLSETAPDLARERLEELISKGLSQNSLEGNYARRALAKLAAADPDAARDLIESLPPTWGRTVEFGLVSASLQRSFAEGMRELWDRPDGWQLFAGASLEGKSEKLRAELANLPDHWREQLARNPGSFIGTTDAVQWLGLDLEAQGFSPEQSANIRYRAMRNAVYRNAAEVFGQLDSVELTESRRRNLITNGIANAKPEDVEDLLALLPSEEDREIARKSAPTAEGSDNSTRTNPTTAAEWFEAFEGPNTPSAYTHAYAIRNWSAEERGRLASGFRELPAETRDGVAEAIVSNSLTQYLTRELEAEAIAHVLHKPAEELEDRRWRTVDRKASQLAVSWLQSDPQAASDWVNSLPQGDARSWAQKNLARQWSFHDPEASANWVRSLPAETRAEVESFLEEQR